MDLSSLIRPELVHLHSPMASKIEVVRHLLGHMGRQVPGGLDLEAVEAAIEARDALGGTTFSTGIAIPHARLEGFDDTLIGICVPQEPIDLEGVSGRMIVLMLTSKAAPGVYLNALAAFIRISQNEQLFSRLLHAASPGDFLGAVRQAGITVREHITVADVMIPEVPRTKPEAALHELADMFYSTGATYAAVTDSEGRLLGEVRLLDLLQVGLPPFTAMVENLKFLESFAPLEALAQKEDTLTVGEIMTKSPTVIAPESSIVEAVFELTRHQRECLPVVSSGRLVGLLCAADLLRRVVRG